MARGLLRLRGPAELPHARGTVKAQHVQRSRRSARGRCSCSPAPSPALAVRGDGAAGLVFSSAPRSWGWGRDGERRAGPGAAFAVLQGWPRPWALRELAALP